MISHHLNLKIATLKPYLKEISASMNLTAILAISKYRAPPRPARIALSRSYGHTYDLAKASPPALALAIAIATTSDLCLGLSLSLSLSLGLCRGLDLSIE